MSIGETGQDKKQGIRDYLEQSATHLEKVVIRLDAIFVIITGEDRPVDSKSATQDDSSIDSSANRIGEANRQAFEWLDKIEQAL